MAITQIKGSNIEDGTVLAADIKDDSITNTKIKSDAAIAMTKLAVDPTDASNIISGTLPAGRYTDTVYTHPTTAGNKHIPTAGATDQVLTYSSSGTAAWADSGGGPSLGTDAIIRTNGLTISDDITFVGDENGVTYGPITIANTKTVIVTSPSVWHVL
tara:strand:+ start:31 stop:504 length:474 start_codon:yes stop_codon:yes gene_type:complete